MCSCAVVGGDPGPQRQHGGGITLGAHGLPSCSLNKSFTRPIAQISQQLNSVVMALAGAQRIFDLLDEEPERTRARSTLVNAKDDQDGNLVETTERTGLWAWKRPQPATAPSPTPSCGAT